ncbi:MAG: hypothetical protein WAM42_16755 [Candidatus Nitrosopolaris sp.]
MSKTLGYTLPYLVILSIWLIFVSPLVTNLHTAPLQQAVPSTTIPTKTTNSNGFLTYENNSTLGVKIQYPSNWQRDTYNNTVAFFAPSLEEGNKKNNSSNFDCTC